jgi:hypothetical protein
MLFCLFTKTFFSVVLLLVSTDSAHGWGSDDHTLIAAIAQTLLTDESTTFVRNRLYYLNWQWSKQLHYVDTQRLSDSQ